MNRRFTRAVTRTCALITAALLASCGTSGLDAPSIGLGVSPPVIPLGSSSTLSWTTSGAISCTASGDWSGPRPINGSEVMTPTTTGTFSYTLSCSNSDRGGSITSTLTVGAAAAATAPGSEAARADIGSAPSLLYLPDADFGTLDASRGSIEKFAFAADGSGRYTSASGGTSSFRWTGDAESALALRFEPAAAESAQTLEVSDAASGQSLSIRCVSSLRGIRIERSEGLRVSRSSTSARSCTDSRYDQTELESSTRYWNPAS